jgi:hypothetical protein
MTGAGGVGSGTSSLVVLVAAGAPPACSGPVASVVPATEAGVCGSGAASGVSWVAAVTGGAGWGWWTEAVAGASGTGSGRLSSVAVVAAGAL